jgi:hypothetical protein
MNNCRARGIATTILIMAGMVPASAGRVTRFPPLVMNNSGMPNYGTCQAITDSGAIITIPATQSRGECDIIGGNVLRDQQSRQIQNDANQAKKRAAQQKTLLTQELQDGVNNRRYHLRCDSLPSNSCAALLVRRNAGCRVFALDYRAYGC